MTRVYLDNSAWMDLPVISRAWNRSTTTLSLQIHLQSLIHPSLRIWILARIKPELHLLIAQALFLLFRSAFWSSDQPRSWSSSSEIDHRFLPIPEFLPAGSPTGDHLQGLCMDESFLSLHIVKGRHGVRHERNCPILPGYPLCLKYSDHVFLFCLSGTYLRVHQSFHQLL